MIMITLLIMTKFSLNFPVPNHGPRTDSRGVDFIGADIVMKGILKPICNANGSPVLTPIGHLNLKTYF